MRAGPCTPVLSHGRFSHRPGGLAKPWGAAQGASLPRLAVVGWEWGLVAGWPGVCRQGSAWLCSRHRLAQPRSSCARLLNVAIVRHLGPAGTCVTQPRVKPRGCHQCHRAGDAAKSHHGGKQTRPAPRSPPGLVPWQQLWHGRAGSFVPGPRSDVYSISRNLFSIYSQWICFSTTDDLARKRTPLNQEPSEALQDLRDALVAG